MHPNPTIDSSPVTSSVSSATQEFLTVDPRKKRTPAPLNSEASGSASERPLAEIISEKFLPFDSATYILEPLQAVVEKDAMVDEAYTTMLLDVILQTHAWATAPSKCKYDLECKKLEDQNSRILNTEQEQEKAREGLAVFVTKMKAALAALTGVDS